MAVITHALRAIGPALPAWSSNAARRPGRARRGGEVLRVTAKTLVNRRRRAAQQLDNKKPMTLGVQILSCFVHCHPRKTMRCFPSLRCDYMLAVGSVAGWHSSESG
jgi:hypothetical protein